MHDFYGRRHEHDGVPFLHWLVPLLVLALLAGGIVWLVVRVGFDRRGSGGAPSTAGIAPAAVDPALGALRMRYARGELSREEFARISRDLGGVVPPDLGDTPPGG